jgi:hypothetical protein
MHAIVIDNGQRLVTDWHADPTPLVFSHTFRTADTPPNPRRRPNRQLRRILRRDAFRHSFVSNGPFSVRYSGIPRGSAADAFPPTSFQ